MRFISDQLDVAGIKNQIKEGTKTVLDSGISVPLFDGAVNIDSFLDPVARQLLEGQIYSAGFDLTKVYKTSKTGHGDNETEHHQGRSASPVDRGSPH